MLAAKSGAFDVDDWSDEGVDEVLVSGSSSSWRDDSDRSEPNKLDGRPDFCRFFGRVFGMSLSRLLLELVRCKLEPVGLGVGDCSEKPEEGRLFFNVAGALSGTSSSIGVRAVRAGRNMLRLLRLRLSGIVSWQSCMDQKREDLVDTEHR